MIASARKSFRAPSTTTIPFDCSTIIELFGLPVMSVLPVATGTGTMRSAGPSLGKPNFANDISHSVMRAPRAASVALNVGRTPDGKRNRAALLGRLTASDVRFSVRIVWSSTLIDTLRGERTLTLPERTKRQFA